MPGSASPTFNKRERIVSRTLIEKLFSKGSSQSTSAFPLRVVYMQEERKEGEEPVQILISVSKRHFKRAVKRNRVKRQIRECYRHHKQKKSLKDKRYTWPSSGCPTNSPAHRKWKGA